MTEIADRAPTGRAVAVLLAVAAAIAVPVWQMRSHFGLSAAEFSAQGDSTLAAAPFAFAIWGLIYGWLVLYALYQLWPREETERLHVLAWASVLPILGCAAWIIASALNARWASVAIIAVSAAFLVGELVRAAHVPGGRVEALFLVWPLGLLAGWLTVAAALNLLTVMTAEGMIGAAAAQLYALGGIGAVTVLAVLLQRNITAPTFGIAVAWGLVGIAALAWGADQTKAIAAAAGAVVAAGAAVAYRAKNP